MKMYRLLQVCVFCAAFSLTGCASGPHFSGNADMCGVVIDSGGNPVKGYCVSLNGGIKAHLYTFTNENGLFQFHDISCGSYILSGYGKGWGMINKQAERFCDRSSLFYLQVETSGSLLMSAACAAELGDYQKALHLLEEITALSGSRDYMLVSYCKAVIKYKQKKYDEARRELSHISEKDLLRCSDEFIKITQRIDKGE